MSVPTFHILIPTSGRWTLRRQLYSLLPQLSANDYVTIVFDGVEVTGLQLPPHVCTVRIRQQPVRLGFWGHGVRNEWATKLEKTTYVMHANEDGEYTPDAFERLRRECTDPDSLYIASMVSLGTICPMTHQVMDSTIGTVCGIIPYKYNCLGGWSYRYGGQIDFYKFVIYFAKTVVFLHSIIYRDTSEGTLYDMGGRLRLRPM